MVKIDLITGFLGAGKTTFIKEYARYLINRGERICIIENDYGAVNIDMVMLQDLLGENCNLEMIVGGDGQEAHRRRFRTKLISMGMSGYDRVLIEPSGIYDVDEFFDVLYDDPLDRWYEIGSVISLVDAEALSGTADQANTESLPTPIGPKSATSASASAPALSDIERYVFMSEIANAGKLLITKINESVGTASSTTNTGTAASTSSDTGPTISSITTTVNSIMQEFGCKTFAPEKDFIAKPFSAYTDEDFEALTTCGYRHASYVKIPIEDKQFTPLFYFDPEMSRQELEEITKSLFSDPNAGSVIRVKGFVKTSGTDQVEINATAKKLSITPIKSSRNVLIIIGEKLNKDYINAILKDKCSVVSL